MLKHGDYRSEMINPEHRLSCRLDGLTAATREQKRLLAMEELGLLEAKSIPIFDEAAQMAAHFLDMSICILGLMEQERQRFKSAVGLSRLGLMNELATLRQFPRTESFCTHVVDSHQILSIGDTLSHPAFASSILTHQYGIRSYLGVPLLTSGGFCVGTLAVMDLSPHQFTTKEIEFLELTARWCMSEFERMQGYIPESSAVAQSSTQLVSESQSVANQLKVALLSHLTQELRTPLTSVMGMASVLNREIYGPLTGKQKEYLNIIHNSGQYLLSLVNEIIELSSLDYSHQGLNLAAVDIEMLCQQAINTLEQVAQRREQEISLSVEPGRRIWLLDKDKVRQMLYHLVFSVIQVSNAGSIVRLHVSHRGKNLIISVWVSHPWLGEGLPYPDLGGQPSLASACATITDVESYGVHSPGWEGDFTGGKLGLVAPRGEGVEKSRSAAPKPDSKETLHSNLGVLLSHQLAAMHGGQITVQGSPETGYRYLISLPQLVEATEGL